jgi:hypothetical protein
MMMDDDDDEDVTNLVALQRSVFCVVPGLFFIV